MSASIKVNVASESLNCKQRTTAAQKQVSISYDFVENCCQFVTNGWKHPIFFGQTGCSCSKTESDALLAANAASKTTFDPKSSSFQERVQQLGSLSDRPQRQISLKMDL